MTLRMLFERVAALEEQVDRLTALRPRIVCICGSTRFAAHMNREAERLTLDGAIVVRPEVVAYSRERDQQFVEPEVKARLDELHLRKIDLADEVVVVTVNGYIGESTRREIAYARKTGKPVRFEECGLAEEALGAHPSPEQPALDWERLAEALHAARLRYPGGTYYCGDLHGPYEFDSGPCSCRMEMNELVAGYLRLGEEAMP
jgi:hypothetical protein